MNDANLKQEEKKMGYPRCFEVDRDIVEERRDRYGYSSQNLDSNYNYNMMIARARSKNSDNNTQTLSQKSHVAYYIVCNKKRIPVYY